MQNEVFDENREYDFEVESTGRTMGMFSSTVYTDRPLAVVRELIFNARDAHASAGKADEPIIIHLPSKAKPYFSVKDTGTGLSPQGMVDVYVRFGKSTKDGIQATGKLGIGAKAPLSFVDHFTVVSCVDGIKRTYRVSRENEHAKPKLGIPTREETDEPNGLEVIVEVKNRDDHASFANALAETLAYFDPDPVVLNAPEGFKAKKPEVAFEGDGYRLLVKPHSTGYHSYVAPKPRAVMARIAYPIESDKIPNLSEAYSGLFQHHIDIDFKPETLVFNAGREALSYEADKTIPNIKRRAARVIADMTTRIDEIFSGYTTRLDALRAYNVKKSTYPTSVLIHTAGVRWKGQEIDGTFKIPLADFPDVAFKFEVLTAKGYNSDRRERDTREYYNGMEDGRGRAIKQVSISPGDRLHILINDVERGAGVRFREYQNQQWVGSFLFLEGSEESIAKVLEIFDGVTDVVRASELEKPKVQKPKTQAKIVPRMGAMNAGSVNKDEIWSYDIDMEDGGYYILTRQGHPEGVTEHEFKDIYIQSHKHGFVDDTTSVIAVVPATLSAAFVKNPKWKLFVPEMKAKAKKLLAKPESITFLANTRDASQAKYAQSNTLRALVNLVPYLPKDNALHGILALLAKRDEDTEKGVALSLLSKAFGFGTPEHEVADPLKGQFVAFFQRYPLVNPVVQERRWYQDVYDEDSEKARAEWAAPIAEYIALIDAKDDKGPGATVKPETRRSRQSWGAKVQPRLRHTRGNRARAVA